MDERKHQEAASAYRGGGSSLKRSSPDYDKIQCIGSSIGSSGSRGNGFLGQGEVRDAFSWDDSCFSLADSEMDAAKEGLFEAMRSGYVYKKTIVIFSHLSSLHPPLFSMFTS